jgi:hypothetical protein
MIGIPFLPPQYLNATRLVVEPLQSLTGDNGGCTRGLASNKRETTGSVMLLVPSDHAHQVVHHAGSQIWRSA